VGVSITPPISPVVVRPEGDQNILDENIWSINTRGTILSGNDLILTIITSALPLWVIINCCVVEPTGMSVILVSLKLTRLASVFILVINPPPEIS